MSKNCGLIIVRELLDEETLLGCGWEVHVRLQALKSYMGPIVKVWDQSAAKACRSFYIIITDAFRPLPRDVFVMVASNTVYIHFDCTCINKLFLRTIHHVLKYTVRGILGSRYKKFAIDHGGVFIIFGRRNAIFIFSLLSMCRNRTRN